MGGIVASANRIRVTGADGSVRFDTAEGLFHVTDTLSGTLNIAWPSVVPQDTAFTRVETYGLGSCHSSATHVFGAFSTQGDSVSPDGTWYPIGGTYVHRISGYKSPTLDRRAVLHWVAYSWRVSGGQLWLDEDVHFESYVSETGQSTLAGGMAVFNIVYRAKVGLFT